MKSLANSTAKSAKSIEQGYSSQDVDNSDNNEQSKHRRDCEMLKSPASTVESSPVSSHETYSESMQGSVQERGQFGGIETTPVRDNSLRMISMRVQKDVISQLKAIAARKGIGYQPYIRMLLTEHISQANDGR